MLSVNQSLPARLVHGHAKKERSPSVPASVGERLWHRFLRALMQSLSAWTV